MTALAEATKGVEDKETEQQRLLSFVVRNPDAIEAEAMLNAMRPELALLKRKRDQLQEDLDKARQQRS